MTRPKVSIFVKVWVVSGMVPFTPYPKLLPLTPYPRPRDSHAVLLANLRHVVETHRTVITGAVIAPVCVDICPAKCCSVISVEKKQSQR